MTTGEGTAAGTARREGNPSRPAAAFFDLDKTIIARSSAFVFSSAFQAEGLISRTTLLRSAYSQAKFLASGADHDRMERMRQFMSGLVTGWDVQTVRDIIADNLHATIDPIIYDEAIDLIEQHHAEGRDVIIISTSGHDMVEPIGKMLGADHVVATRMEISEGKYTGNIRFYAYAEAKATAIKDLARTRGYDLAECYGYSDSITDLHMLEVVGHPYAVNPDKELRKAATERGWPILVFDEPVSLRAERRLPPPRPAAIGAGSLLLAIAIGLGALAWYRTRRRAEVKP